LSSKQRQVKNGKKEILFYYESRQNPNGDPGFDNQPRLMPDGRIIVTDVRIKRTMRDYAKRVFGETLFVDFNEKGDPINADDRAKGILDIKSKIDKDIIEGLLKNTFDVPLFGALVTIRPENEGKSGSSQKLTGPLQFGISRSVNQIQIINPQISTHFVGAENVKQEEQFATLGRFYSVEYALIKVHGALNPQNLGKYLSDSVIKKKFDDCNDKIFNCLWKGTNELITRSKFPQRSILYLEITYKDTIYNDLPNLVDERKDLKERPSTLGISPFNFEELLSAIKERKNEIEKIRIKGCLEINNDVNTLVREIEKIKVLSDKVEELCKVEETTRNS
jgi:CRISPR-associated protein Csh2